MTEFTLHTQDTAPDAAKPLLENSMKGFGFIPNLHGMMAESPAMLEAYQTMYGLGAKTGLSAIERQVVYQVNNFEAGCRYCVAAHSTISAFDNVPEDVTAALRAGTRIPNAKLEALATFTKKIRNGFGHITEADEAAFFAAGYSKANVLDVILLTATKVLSNYTNHVAKTPVDDRFQAQTWEKPEAVAAE